MLIVYEHNTIRRINSVSMKDYQTNNTDVPTLQYDFQSATGFYSPTSQTIGQLSCQTVQTNLQTKPNMGKGRNKEC